MPRLLLALFLLSTAACVSQPDTFAPPVQRKPMTGGEARPFGHFANMNDPNAEAYFVSDIRALESGSWRWTGKKPVLRFFLDVVDSLKFAADYTVTDHTFKATGPVVITVTVNGHVLDRIRRDRAGEAHFEKPVPAEWLKIHDVNEVSLEVDKPWISPDDGAVLGFILARAGFIQ